jgi:hypothetical protein
LEYQFVDVGYDSSLYRDNTQDFYYVGINWASSEKTSVRLKTGYQFKNYEADSIQETDISSNDDLALELALKYQITVKTEVSLALSHKIEESDSWDSLDKEVSAGTLHYQQQFTDKLLGLCDFSIESADYDSPFQFGTRDDDRYVFRPALQYVFKEWLMAELAYQYDTRSSTEELYEYDSNTLSISLNSAF